jgi:ankyrin repeat protein
MANGTSYLPRIAEVPQVDSICGGIIRSLLKRRPLMNSRKWLSGKRVLGPIRTFTATLATLTLCMSVFSFSACTRRQADMQVLFTAVSKKDAAAFNLEFRKGFSPERLNQLDGEAEMTILHAAAQEGSSDIVKTLIDSGVKPDLRLTTGETPLVLASSLGRTDTAKILLDRGAKVDSGAESRLGTPLIEAALGGHLDTVRLLVEHGANVNLGAGSSNPLTVAAQGGHKEVVEFLLRSGAQSNGLMADMVQKEHPEIGRMLRAADPSTQLLKRSNAAQAEYNKLRVELAAFLRNAAQTGYLDKTKLARYQYRLQTLQNEFGAIVGER